MSSVFIENIDRRFSTAINTMEFKSEQKTNFVCNYQPLIDSINDFLKIFFSGAIAKDEYYARRHTFYAKFSSTAFIINFNSSV